MANDLLCVSAWVVLGRQTTHFASRFHPLALCVSFNWIQSYRWQISSNGLGNWLLAQRWFRIEFNATEVEISTLAASHTIARLQDGEIESIGHGHLCFDKNKQKYRVANDSLDLICCGNHEIRYQVSHGKSLTARWDKRNTPTKQAKTQINNSNLWRMVQLATNGVFFSFHINCFNAIPGLHTTEVKESRNSLSFFF